MPTLEWIGKNKVVNHHQEVPFRVLERQYSFDEQGQHIENNGSENMIIHGDNLEALKALLPQYEGKVKCIYIDPPYNTGNEGWCYNDNVSDPHIQKWLGEVVGKEGEDLTRHDKWLCMMYPRLMLLQKLLADDGVIFISIDDTEQSFLRLICDEIFGINNFLANIAWEKRYTRSNNAKLFYSLKDSILCYRKSNELSVLKEARTAKADSNYANPDNDPRGEWMTASYVNPATKEARPNLSYEIHSPDGRTIVHPTHAWKYSYEEHLRHVKENRLWWGNDGTAKFPRLKLYKNEMPGMVPVDLWNYKDTGTTDDGGNTIKSIVGNCLILFPTFLRSSENTISGIRSKNPISRRQLVPHLQWNSPVNCCFILRPQFGQICLLAPHIALLELCKDFFSRHTAGKQLLQHIFCFALLCFFHCLCFGGSFFVFGFGKFLGDGFQFCFLGFHLRFQIIEICSQRSNLRFNFFLFSGLFCNDGCIINAGLYSTSLILASLGSCHNNFLP